MRGRMLDCTYVHTAYEAGVSRAWPEAASVMRWQRIVLRYVILRAGVSRCARTLREREILGRRAHTQWGQHRCASFPHYTRHR